MTSARRRGLPRASAVFVLSLLAVAGASVPAGAQVTADLEARTDAIFEEWDVSTSPGCAVAVEEDGRTVLSRAWGMADLEHDVANTPETIFEAGSVSKQFTAAAIVLLEQEGRLSLDDDVRTYVPELPDYGPTITIRHLMTHTSGLRDWGSVAGIAGWGRSQRTHTHAHVLDILSRQSALNFEPGEQYSYSNSGYNLQAIIVDRVSGTSFADFSRERIFEPLGMHDTQWRDDYRRIVKGRSSAYRPRGEGFAIDRPIENVHGNGGLLTTVDDLLRWNRELESGDHFGPGWLERMHLRGRLNSGEEISYGAGLMHGERNGRPSVSHTGSTSGYRAYLARFPEDRLSVALLCNVGNASPGRLGGQVADLFLPEPIPASTPEQRGPPGEGGQEEEPDPPAPTAAELEAYVGAYHSADAEVTFRLAVDDGELVLHRRPDDRFALRPTGSDEFRGGPGGIRFIRDGDGRVVELSVSQSRVFDLRFRKVR